MLRHDTDNRWRAGLTSWLISSTPGLTRVAAGGLVRARAAPAGDLAKAALRFLLPPLARYLGIFCALTYPLIGSISSQFFTNAADGLQNVWNLWWVNRGVTVLHTSPRFTTYLSYPPESASPAAR